MAPNLADCSSGDSAADEYSGGAIRLKREKKNFTQELSNLEGQRQELEELLHQKRERAVVQQQQFEHHIR